MFLWPLWQRSRTTWNDDFWGLTYDTPSFAPSIMLSLHFLPCGGKLLPKIVVVYICLDLMGIRTFWASICKPIAFPWLFWWNVHASCVAIVDMFSSINMTSTTTKSVSKLEGEIMLISCSNETWEMWPTLCDAHNAKNLVNQQILKIYTIEKDIDAQPVSKKIV